MLVAGYMKAGYYQTQSEVLREGLRLLKEREDLSKFGWRNCERRSPPEATRLTGANS